jgi:hypothetical protein
MPLFFVLKCGASNKSGYCKRAPTVSNASVLVENKEDRPQGSDIQGLSADLIEGA